MKYLSPSEVASQINEGRPTNIMGLIQQISEIPYFDKLIKGNYIADGAVGLFRSTDGNAYEIVIRPAAYAKHIET